MWRGEKACCSLPLSPPTPLLASLKCRDQSSDRLDLFVWEKERPCVCGTGCARLLLPPRSAWRYSKRLVLGPGGLWESDVFWNDSAASNVSFSLFDMVKFCESAVSESLSEPTFTRVQPREGCVHDSVVAQN